MVQISAALVKELRDKTGAGMMDCKRALGETAADVEQAVDWLRKNGLSAAANKAGRIAAEGLVGVCIETKKGAIVEVNAETDFVARNEGFQAFVDAVVNDKEPPIIGNDGLQPVLIGAAAIKSLKEKRPVRIEEILG